MRKKKQSVLKAFFSFLIAIICTAMFGICGILGLLYSSSAFGFVSILWLIIAIYQMVKIAMGL